MDSLFRQKTFYETLLRYLLGMTMLLYGSIKIAGIQFAIPSALLEEPLKNISGVDLTWIFLGHSQWFSVLLGFFELVPAVLLLFHRTRLLGALLLFPVMLNVFLINIAFDFLPEMKILTGILLLINVVLLYFHYDKLKAFSTGIIKNDSPAINKKSSLEWTVNLILIAIISFLLITIYRG